MARSLFPWPDLVAAIQNLQPAVRMKWSGDDDLPPWEAWIIVSSVSYLETGRVGPVPFSEVEWVEIDPFRKNGIGRLVPADQAREVREALDHVRIPYSEVGDCLRVSANTE